MTEEEKRRDVVGYDELGELISGDEDEKRNKGKKKDVEQRRGG